MSAGRHCLRGAMEPVSTSLTQILRPSSLALGADEEAAGIATAATVTGGLGSAKAAVDRPAAATVAAAMSE